MNKNKNEEIIIFDFIDYLLQKKIKILLTILLFSLIGLLFANNQKSKVYLEFQLHPLSIENESQYHSLNHTGFYSISSDILFDLFIEKFNSSITSENIFSNDLVDNKNDYLKKYSYIEEVSLTITHQKLYFLNIRALDTKDTFKEIDRLLNDLNDSIYNFLLSDISNQIQVRENNLFYKIEKIEKDIEDLKNQINRKRSVNLTLLKKHRKIAFEKNIKYTNTEVQFDKIDKSINTALNPSYPYYLLGYELIDSAISYYKGVEKFNIFSNELLNKKMDVSNLISVANIENIKSSIFQTPLNSIKNFKTIDLRRTEIKKTNSMKFVLIFSFIGSFLAFILYLTKFAYLTSKKSK